MPANSKGWSIEQAGVFSRRGLAGEEHGEQRFMERLMQRKRHVDIATLEKASIRC